MFSGSQQFLDCGIVAKNHERINQSFLKQFVASHSTQPKRLILDFDATQ